MFDNIGRVAERVATKVSRRRFFGSLGRWAAATAMGLAGVLTTPGSARAGNQNTCCIYGYGLPDCYKCVKLGQTCPATGNGIPLMGSSTTDGCGGCYSVAPARCSS